MKKIDRLGLKVKGKLYRFTLWYATMFLSLQMSGSIQDLFNCKEIKQYREVVEDFGEFLESNGIDDPIEIFDYYNYALWGGYLSQDHEFKFDTNRDLFFDNYGIGCIKGESVCLNNAGMLSDLYESMGIDSNIVMCYVPIGKVSVESIRNQEEITREVAENNESFLMTLLMNTFARLSGNHAVTMVNYEEEYYYFDPTNLVYLFKSGPYRLDIINGEGHFTKRYLSSSIFEGPETFANILDNNKDDYNYLNKDDPEIDPVKLEEFYQSEKELIDSVANSLDKKPQLLILILSLFISSLIVPDFKRSFDKLFNKNKKNEFTLKMLISLFMMEQGINKFEDMCVYLNYLINNGYLTYDDKTIKLEKRVVEDSIAMITLDSQEYGEVFFKSYMEREGVKIVLGIDKDRNIEIFYVCRENNKYIFYSYKDNLLYRLNDNLELINGDKSYKLIKLFKGKYRNSEKFDQDIEPDVDYKLCDEFEEKNRQIINDIAKTYGYVPKR